MVNWTAQFRGSLDTALVRCLGIVLVTNSHLDGLYPVSQLATGIPTSTQAYTLAGLTPYSLYAITLTVRDSGNAILTRSNTLSLLTTDRHVYLPITLRNTPGEY